MAAKITWKGAPAAETSISGLAKKIEQLEEALAKRAREETARCCPCMHPCGDPGFMLRTWVLFRHAKPIPWAVSEREAIEMAWAYSRVENCSEEFARQHGARKTDLVGARLGDVLDPKNPRSEKHIGDVFRNKGTLKNSLVFEVDPATGISVPVWKDVYSMSTAEGLTKVLLKPAHGERRREPRER